MASNNQKFSQELSNRLMSRTGLTSNNTSLMTNPDSSDDLNTTMSLSKPDNPVVIVEPSKHLLIQANRAKSALNMQRNRRLPSSVLNCSVTTQDQPSPQARLRITESMLEDQQEVTIDKNNNKKPTSPPTSPSCLDKKKRDKSKDSFLKSPQFKGNPTPRSRKKSLTIDENSSKLDASFQMNTTQELLSNVSLTTDSSIGSICMANEQFSLHSPTPLEKTNSKPISVSIERAKSSINANLKPALSKNATPEFPVLKPVRNLKAVLKTDSKEETSVKEENPEILNLKAGLKPVSSRKPNETALNNRPISMFVCSSESKPTTILEEIARKRNEIQSKQWSRNSENTTLSEINQNNTKRQTRDSCNDPQFQTESISDRIKNFNEKISQNSSSSSRTCSQTSLQTIDPPSISKNSINTKTFNVYDETNDRENVPMKSVKHCDSNTSSEQSFSIADRVSVFGQKMKNGTPKSSASSSPETSNSNAENVCTQNPFGGVVLKKRRESLKKVNCLNDAPLKEAMTNQPHVTVSHEGDKFKTTVVRRNCGNQLKDVDANSSVRASRVFELVKTFQNLS